MRYKTGRPLIDPAIEARIKESMREARGKSARSRMLIEDFMDADRLFHSRHARMNPILKVKL